MSAAPSSDRQVRGAAIAKNKAGAFRHIAGDSFFVPSQTKAGSGYVVDVSLGKCSCPDFEEWGEICKHVWAVRYFRHELEIPDKTIAANEEPGITRPRDWSLYNAYQCDEEDRTRILLDALCQAIDEPERKMGRPSIPLRDMVYAMAMKVHGTKSCRRSKTALRECGSAGHMERVPAYNTIFKYMEKPELLPLLSKLVDESARPLAVVEKTFAVDATCFASQTYVRWFDHKHGTDGRVKQWVKCHAMVGTLTNVVTAAKVTVGSDNDCPEFIGLVERTAQNFNVEEVSADKAYLSNPNLAAVERVGGVPFIPFKSNSVLGGSPAWDRMFHYCALNRENFLRHYHRRSNVETTFSAIKAKFGVNLRSKVTAAQYNEVLLKCLCHNLSALVRAIHELNIEPEFWLPQREDA